MTRALCLAVLLCPAVARATSAALPPLTETFGDWVLIRSDLGVLAARKSDFDAAYARQQAAAGGAPLEIALYKLTPKDEGEPGSTLAVTATQFHSPLRLYPKGPAGVPMAVSHCDKPQCQPSERMDVSGRRCDMTRAADCREREDGLRFRGDWTRPIRVRTESGAPFLSSDEAAIAKLPEAKRALARAMLKSDRQRFHNMVAEWQDGKSPLAALASFARAQDQLRAAQRAGGGAETVFDASGRRREPEGVVASAPPGGAPDARPSLVNAQPGAGGSVVRPGAAAPPPPVGKPDPRPGGGPLSNPWVTGIAGAAIGGLLGKMLFGAMLGGPFGILVGAAVGGALGLTLPKLFGGG